jgi:signal transduction histidine kinase/DNA-binding response OmpR family regulator/ligand-binding sensor domain-containing protein
MLRVYFSILFVCTYLSWGQQIQFNYLSVKDGLSQHDVSSIMQDSDGFIWIGTYDGLNRFDGYSIKKYFHDLNDPSSLSSNRIKTLFEDKNKRIWIGTDGYGLNYYDIEMETFTRVLTPDNYDIINDITLNVNNEIIAGTNQGLLKVVDNKGKFSTEIIQSPITGFNVKNIFALDSTNILYATERGLWKKQNDAYSFLKESLDISFSKVIQTSTNQIWLASNKGLYTLNNEDLIYKNRLVKDNVLAISEGINNMLWISTFSDGLYTLDLTREDLSKVEANDYQINKTLDNPLIYLYKDRTNTLWISNKNGLLYTNLESNKFKHLPIIKNGHVRTLFSTDTELYYGYQSDKFYVYNFQEKTNRLITLPENTNAFKVDTLSDNIYLATSRGLYKQSNLNEHKFDLVSIFNNEIDTTTVFTSFEKDAFGNQFFGTFKGLIHKTNKGAEWIHDKFENLEYLRNVRIFSLLYDNYEKCLWVGTISEGLYKINLDNSGQIISAEHFSKEMKGDYKIDNNTIWCFYKNEENQLFLGTDAGLFVKKPNQSSFESLMVDGIVNKKIMGITVDDSSNLWLNNSQGIIRYNLQSNLVKTYNYYDGLQTNTFTEGIGRNARGELFFASIAGINYLNPKGIVENKFTSNVAFTNLLVNNEKVNVNEEILGSVLLEKNINATKKVSFNYKQNDFTIEFTSTNYSNTNVNSYRYKLENYEEDWTVVDNDKRYANYSNLPGGDYILKIESTNPNGKWEDNYKTLNIKIFPAPWDTWWAYSIYFLVILSILFVIFYFYTNKQKLRNQIALSNLRNEKEKEINELKLIFFTDVAHEFKTPLSLVIGPLNELISGSLTKEHKEFCYKILSRNTNRMMNLVNQLLDFRKINSGSNILKVSRNDICEFVREIAKSFEWQAKNSNINFSVISPERYFCHFDKDILEKVIFNLLSNAFKYTPNDGRIIIEIKPTFKQDLEYFVIIIKDSGKGIPQGDKKKIFQRHFHGKDRSSSGIGLHLTSTLLEAHRGEINVLNSSLGGTEFMVTLPVSSKAFKEDEFLTKDDIPTNIPYDHIPGQMPEELDLEKDTNREKILIVEDDYDLRKYLHNLLSRDYMVLEAVNGKDGLDLAIKEMPDIVVSDVMMPEMDGIELCKRIKKNTLISHIPVLMLTAKTGEDFYNTGLKVGAWDYIAKPFDSKQLFQKIKNIIETRNNFRAYLNNGNTIELANHYVSYDQKFVEKITSIVKEKVSEPSFSVELLSIELGMSRMQLHRKLKSLTGMSSTAFINKIRIEISTKMFDNGCDRVQEAMDAIGISSYAYFNNLFKKEKGLSPSKYIESIKNEIAQ